MTRSMPAHNKHLVQVNLAAGLCELKMSKILFRINEDFRSLEGHGGMSLLIAGYTPSTIK